MADSGYQIKKLEDLNFIAGHSLKLKYRYVNSNSEEPVNLMDYTFFLNLMPAGQEDYLVFSKQGVLDTDRSDTFVVTLTTNDTKDLGDTYTQIPVLIGGGNKKKPAWGNVCIEKASTTHLLD